MKKNKLLPALLVIVLGASLAGAAAAGEKSFVYNLAVEPRTIDPVLNNAVDGSVVIFNLFEGLVRIGLDDAPEAGHAESWEVSEDGMTWTFHLRKGLKWSDGVPITAEHFRYGFLRLLDPENASPYAHYGFCLKNGEAYYNGKAKAEDVGLKAVDDATFVIQLEFQTPLLLDYLAYHIFFPARPEIVAKDPRGWTSKPETIVCNGPFVLTDWQHNSEMTIKKNPNYWDADSVKIDGVRLVMITDSNTALAAFKAGKLDFLKTPPAPMLPQLFQSGEAKVAPTLGTSFSVFNVKKKPFDDVRVRKAFALAVDRTALVEKVTMGKQKPAAGFIPYGIPGPAKDKDFRAASGKDYLPLRADVEGAKKLLAEAGYPDGKGFPKVTYKYNSNVGNTALAEALQAMWKQNLGVEVELFAEEWKVFIDTRAQHNFEIARHAYLVDFFDAGSLLELWLTGTYENYAEYSDARYDEVVKASLREMDTAKRVGYLLEAEDILMRDMPVLPLYFYATPYMQSARVKNIYISPRNWDFFRAAEVVE
jgi:oligopeptide transport system substrate-binding protein